jgi:hypothetical protein
VGLIENAKDLVALVQKLDNIELIKTVLALQQDAVVLIEENHALKHEVRGLKETLAIREQLVFQHNAYFRGADGPFCSRCWDAEEKLVRLHRAMGYNPRCPSCGNSAVDPNKEPPKPVRRFSKSPYLRGD